MRHLKKFTLLAVAMVIAVSCARYGFTAPITRFNFTW
jgi:hypothetical protein